MRRYLFLFIIIQSAIFPQRVCESLNGFVYDARDGEALIGANVHLRAINNGTTTNNGGYFVLSDIPYGEYVLSVSFIGYQSQLIKISVNKRIMPQMEVRLSFKSIETEAVVIVADSMRAIDKLYEKPVSKIELSSKQVSQIPRVIEADLLRALQTLPGITALSDFSSALYVRGGTPDQNLYLIDGTDVYNPEHAFGIFSTFNTNAIKKVELSKGGFGAEFGGRLSSVLNVTNLDGNRNNFEGFANVSLLSASATLQFPLGSFGSLSGSLRRTYIDQTYAKVVKTIPAYYFYDGNLKAFFDLGGSDKLTASYFGSRDNLDFKLDKSQPSSFGFMYEWGNQTASLNWRHLFTPKLYSTFWTTYSSFQSEFDFQSVNFAENNKIHDLSLKGALEYYQTDNNTIKFGFEHKFLGGMLQQFWESGKVDVTKTRSHSIAYISSSYKPLEGLLIELGIRYNYFNSDNDYTDFEPRFSVKYRLDESSNLKFATGRFVQYANRISRLFFTSIWTTADDNVRGSSSNHYILGYQKAFENVYEFEAEGYYKTYNSIYQYNQLVFSDAEPAGYENGKPFYTSTKALFNRGDGESYGIELMLRRDAGPVSGWLAYSLSRTNYQFDAINQGKGFIPRQDRASIVNAVLNCDWSTFWSDWKDLREVSKEHKWLISFNFIYTTGQPITVPSSAYFLYQLPDWKNVHAGGENIPAYMLYPSEINKYRLPAYIRLDASITYEIYYKDWTLSPYLQVFNLGNRKNVWFIDYKPELSGGTLLQTVDKTNMLPILPSIGVNIKF